MIVSPNCVTETDSGIRELSFVTAAHDAAEDIQIIFFLILFFSAVTFHPPLCASRLFYFILFHVSITCYMISHRETTWPVSPIFVLGNTTVRLDRTLLTHWITENLRSGCRHIVGEPHWGSLIPRGRPSDNFPGSSNVVWQEFQLQICITAMHLEFHHVFFFLLRGGYGTHHICVEQMKGCGKRTKCVALPLLGDRN